MATSALSFGPVPIFSALWEKLGLPEAIAAATQRGTATYDQVPVIFRIVLGRLLDPSSKLSTHRWAQTIWWNVGAAVELQHYYRALGILSRGIKKIEEHLYHRERDLFTPAPDLLFFYTTSTYFTGAGPMTGMATHGFSKDNRPESKQVIVGVVITREGTPLAAHHVFPENTPDAAVFADVIEELLDAIRVQARNLGGRPRDVQRASDRPHRGVGSAGHRRGEDATGLGRAGDRSCEQSPLRVGHMEPEGKEGRSRGQADIVCLNEEEARRDKVLRDEIFAELREKIVKCPRKTIGNTGYRRYLSVEKDVFHIDEKKISSEKKFDGIYVLHTITELSAKEAALAYKRLWQVELAFREIKSTFEILLVYLSREDRIKGHIAVCFLEFCLQVAFLRIVCGE
jgi:hypothetical protein